MLVWAEARCTSQSPVSPLYTVGSGESNGDGGLSHLMAHPPGDQFDDSLLIIVRQQPPGWFRFSRLEQINRNVTTRRILHFSRTRARGTHSLLCWSTPRRSTSTHCSCPGSAAAAAGDGQGHHHHGGARRRRRRHHHLQPAGQLALHRRYGAPLRPIFSQIYFVDLSYFSCGLVGARLEFQVR